MISSTLRLVAGPLTRSVFSSNGRLAILPCLTFTEVRGIHITSNVMREFRVGSSKVRGKALGKDLVMDGEHTTEIRTIVQKTAPFPDASTPCELFNGIPFDQLHILNVKSTRNNTILSITDFKGLLISLHSAGIEGFKNTKKGTNIAAQQAAYVFGTRIIKNWAKTVRLRIQGIGPGRMGAIKGIQLSGLNVVSITDDTRVSWNPPRPRKARRI
ncbi:mitochondrial ribosomal protein S11 [Xylocopa sonorina]|uniref:mitochondrial ribosomal protein S11 n=1 Tax=Xylocopa sonorina TaxID=1818115 RepID=UPI00403B0BE3